VITTLDRLGRSTINMIGLSDELRRRGVNLRVLNFDGGNVDTGTPRGSMVFTAMARWRRWSWRSSGNGSTTA
jgi:DNA invertase Pin-like site-specific DNA recombinase